MSSKVIRTLDIQLLIWCVWMLLYSVLSTHIVKCTEQDEFYFLLDDRYKEMIIIEFTLPQKREKFNKNSFLSLFIGAFKIKY
jgi:hypothetical protein